MTDRPPDLPGMVRRTAARHALFAPGAGVVVGVSGGVDSLVLLHVLIQLRDALGIRLHAATLDHGLRGAAGAGDAAFVQEIAAAWGVAVTVGQVDAAAVAAERRLGIEEAARAARYAFLAEAARQVDAALVAVGHHQDDQAETVLLHLIRGSGLTGLGGMRAAAPLPGEPGLTLVRPLLDVPRAVIDAYAAARDLHPRQDASNLDPTYTRNRIRHEVLPLLERLNPNIRETLARTAAILQGEADLAALAGQAALERARHEVTPGRERIDHATWRALTHAEKRAVLRALFEGADLSFVQVESGIEIADTGRPGAIWQPGEGGVLRVTTGGLIVARPGGPADEGPTLPAGTETPSFAPGERVTWAFDGWVFSAAPLAPGDDVAALHADPLAAALAIPAGSRLHLRTRQHGDRFAPRGMQGHTQKLSDTLINMHVPADLRDLVPLLIVNGAIAWFVAPTGQGVRGRVAQAFAMGGIEVPGEIVTCVRWRRQD